MSQALSQQDKIVIIQRPDTTIVLEVYQDYLDENYYRVFDENGNLIEIWEENGWIQISPDWRLSPEDDRQIWEDSSEWLEQSPDR